MSATKYIRGACKCRCCDTTVPTFENTTLVADVGTGSTGAGCAGLQTPPGANVAPYTHPDDSQIYTESLCGGKTNCVGAWLPTSISHGVQTFNNTGSSKINDCIFGQKMVVSKKLRQGRYGFTDDYIDNPKIGNFYGKYNVNVQLQESNSLFSSSVTGGVSSSTKTTGSTSGQAQSQHALTAGGIEGCSGTSGSDGGYNVRTDTWSPVDPDCAGNFSVANNFLVDEVGALPCCQSGSGSPEIILKMWNDQSYSGSTAPAQGYNQTVMQGYCGINCDRGNIAITIPLIAGGYTGPASGIAAFLAANSYDTGLVTNPDGSTSRSFVKFSVGSLSVTNTEVTGAISCEIYQSVNSSTNIILNDYTYSFAFTATLSQQMTYSSLVQTATGLLGYIDMSDKLAFPWQSGVDCRIAPMVSLWEQGGAPGWGWSNTPADATLTALYDGSVRGKLMSDPEFGATRGIYAPGWFDFDTIIQSFLTDTTCNDTACYNYGAYLSSYCQVTMATQLVDGFHDSGQCDAPTPFSRFFVGSWIAMVPPYATMTCAFLAGDQYTIYAGKWAEKKVPLPSENFFGPCGAAMQTATLISATCQPMATLRYPGAAATCDAVWSTGAPRGDFVRLTNFNGVITATQENVVPKTSVTAQTDGIIAILPPGSPELATWTGLSNRNFTDGFPMIAPGEFWYQSIQQAMPDRFFTNSQDKQTSNSMHTGCTPIVPPPQTPYVEARITAPAGAPFNFSAGDGNAYNQLPGAWNNWADFSWMCSGVWLMTNLFSALPYTPWPGVSTTGTNASADQYNVGATGDSPNAGLGVA